MTTEPPRDVAALWSDPQYTRLLERAQWMAAPEVLLYLNERATGDSSLDWLSGWAARYFVGHDLRILVLGCGEGWLERSLASLPFVARIDAFDVAAGAVDRARKTGEAMGLTKLRYGVLDLNQATLPRQTYDVVIAHSILHHVERLEHAFAEIEQTLKPDGTLIFNEYVGPSRFQMTDEQMDVMNEILRSLPEELRRGEVEQPIYEKKERPTIEHMIRSDPSEAVRSAELLALVSHRFHVLERVDLGGTVLQHLLYDIVQNFDFQDSRKRSMLELLTLVETTLIDSQALPADFVALAARRKDSRLPLTAYSRPPLRAKAPRSEIETDPVGRRLPGGAGATAAMAACRVAALIRQLPGGIMRVGVADPEIDVRMLASGLRPAKVERLSAEDEYDVIVGAALEESRRQVRRGGYLIGPEALPTGGLRELPWGVTSRMLRIVLLAERSPRRIHIGADAMRGTIERWRYRRWQKRNRSGPARGDRTAGLVRVGSVPRASAPFDYVASRWQPREVELARPLIDLLCCFERIAVSQQLLSPKSNWVAWQSSSSG